MPKPQPPRKQPQTPKRKLLRQSGTVSLLDQRRSLRQPVQPKGSPVPPEAEVPTAALPPEADPNKSYVLMSRTTLDSIQERFIYVAEWLEELSAKQTQTDKRLLDLIRMLRNGVIV